MKRKQKKKYRIKTGSPLDLIIVAAKWIGPGLLLAGAIASWYFVLWVLQYC